MNVHTHLYNRINFIMFKAVQKLLRLCGILLIFQEWQINLLKEEKWIENPQCFKKQFLSELYFFDKLTMISNEEIHFPFYLSFK